MYFFHHQIQDIFTAMIEHIPIAVIVPATIIVLGLVSSIISAILAAIFLVEIVNALPIGRQSKITLAVVSCFSIGLGAGPSPGFALVGTPVSGGSHAAVRRQRECATEGDDGDVDFGAKVVGRRERREHLADGLVQSVDLPLGFHAPADVRKEDDGERARGRGGRRRRLRQARRC